MLVHVWCQYITAQTADYLSKTEYIWPQNHKWKQKSAPAQCHFKSAPPCMHPCTHPKHSKSDICDILKVATRNLKKSQQQN